MSDDFLAWQLRLGLALRVWDSRDEHSDENEQRHRDAIKALDRELKWAS